MALKSDPNRYGAVAVSIHWVSAVLISMLIASGLRAAGALEPAAKAAILRLHIPSRLRCWPSRSFESSGGWASIENLARSPDRRAGRSAARRSCISYSISLSWG